MVCGLKPMCDFPISLANRGDQGERGGTALNMETDTSPSSGETALGEGKAAAQHIC